ncbi:type VII secretion protein EccB [Catenulispora pinisilvae]|uniref:type VII secretion protein EccB n=1 Tax=Catenulispora pinisilvae TaxID=2705253 RepID=UPI00189135CC|nr:type VII secretion protein EccB [Catenulispora pinisilvae]
MWTERDQIQAYQFLRRRLVSALVTSDPNHPTPPHRRLVMGTVLGSVATMLTAAGFGVSGMMAPSPPPDWQHTGLVILEQDGGGRYVLDNNGDLHPVTNLASARLLAGSTKSVTVAANLLSKAPRGATMGIPNAPDTLPDPTSVIADPDPVACSRASSDLPKQTGPVGALLLVHTTDAAATLSGMTPIPDGHGLVVQTPKGDRYLLTAGLKYKLADDHTLIALGYQNVPVLPVAASWLTAVPSGRDLALVAVPDVGTPGPRVAGGKTKVGEVITADNAVAGKTGYYLVRAGGLEPISQIEAALVLANTANAAAYSDGMQAAKQVSVADVAATPTVPTGEDATGYPAGVPSPAAAGGGLAVVCAVGDGKDPSQIGLGVALPLPAGARTVPTGVAQGGTTADEVYLAPGTAALATAPTPPGAQAGLVYLITDAGTKYPLTDGSARSALGYANAPTSTLLPTALGLLPTGPALDEADAQKPMAAGS